MNEIFIFIVLLFCLVAVLIFMTIMILNINKYQGIATSIKSCFFFYFTFVFLCVSIYACLSISIISEKVINQPTSLLGNIPCKVKFKVAQNLGGLYDVY